MTSFQDICCSSQSYFPSWGVNKRQEISRLLYEIVKKERVTVEQIFSQAPQPITRFSQLKRYLISRRYPNSTAGEKKTLASRLRFKAVKDFSEPLQSAVPAVLPGHIYIEDAVKRSELAQRIREVFPSWPVTSIATYKEFTRQQKILFKDYNNRTQNVFIVKERFGFFEKCPCTKKAVSCGYSVLNLGQGCPFNCQYCFLQGYVNSPGIILPSNLDDFLNRLDGQRRLWRIGSGQFTDSLVYDHITHNSTKIIEFFSRRPDWVFEFKTKSANVHLLLSVPAVGNVYAGWSLNPARIIQDVELGTASLDDRLSAARLCQEHGYKLTFHFDPIFFYAGWEKDYEKLITELFEHIDGRRVAWISLGTLRLTSTLKQAIEQRFSKSWILNEEFLPGFDGKLRYYDRIRIMIYKKMIGWIRQHAGFVNIYLCMESPGIWQESGLKFSAEAFQHVY